MESPRRVPATPVRACRGLGCPGRHGRGWRLAEVDHAAAGPEGTGPGQAEVSAASLLSVTAARERSCLPPWTSPAATAAAHLGDGGRQLTTPTRLSLPGGPCSSPGKAVNQAKAAVDDGRASWKETHVDEEGVLCREKKKTSPAVCACLEGSSSFAFPPPLCGICIAE